MGARHAHALHVHGHSPLHRLAPEAKVAGTFVFVAAVAVTPPEALWAFALHAGVAAAAITLGRIPPRFVLTRLAVVLPFIAFAVLIPFVATGARVEVLGVPVSREGLWAAWNVVAKSTLGATASIVLAATTQIPELLRGMSRLRVPAPLTAIAMFMVRYTEIVAGELGRMRTAMAARGYAPRWLWQARPVATAAGALFVRSYERGERVHAAMLARGYTGAMPDLGHRRAAPREWVAAAAPALFAAVVATAAVVTG